MKLHIVQFESRIPYPPNNNYMISLNKDRAAADPDCTYTMYSVSDLPPYWAKVEVVRNKLNEIPVDDVVLWLDTDAVIDDTMGMRELLRSGNFTKSGEGPPWENRWPFNAGVWGVCNNEKGVSIIEYWLSLYDPSTWRRVDGGGMEHMNTKDWECDGPWAGDDYEQGSFVSKVIPKFGKQITDVPWPVFQYCFKDTPEGTLAHHFSCWKHSTWRRKCMWGYFENNTCSERQQR